MHPSRTIVEGAVSPDDEHLALSYGSFDTDKPPFPIVGRVSPPRNGVLTLELLGDDSTTRGKEIIADVRRQVHWLFLEKGEAKPWAYARYHYTTATNAYSNVHWGWASTTSSPERQGST